MIWIALAVLTAVVLAALLVPVVVRSLSADAADRNAYNRAVFLDQLAELERDAERGTIGPAEAEAARNEISRRLIAAAGPNPGDARRSSQSALIIAIVAALLIPAIALPLYLRTGSPGVPDVPLAARMANAEQSGDFEALIVKVENHLAASPNDIEGWKVLAPTYGRLNRWADAAEAYRNILRLAPPNAANLADYGEALVMQAEGMVSAEAHRLFTQALALDAKNPKARFFDALALKQEGKTEESKAAFQSFLADSPADAPWRSMVTAEIDSLTGRPPAIDSQTMANAANMSEADRQAMIGSMVDGLEQKLAANPDDLDGWLRLIRARAVLGEADKAKAAYDKALVQFSGNGDALAQIASLGREMKIQ
jgi:cytochrome c-type biogenesis protein CcmH